MDSKLQIFFIIAVVVYLIAIIHLLKRGKLNLKYTILWLVAAFVLLIATIFPNLMYLLSSIVGIETPINSAIVLASMFMVIILITLTSIVSSLNQTLRSLVQKVALLEKELREIANEEKDDRV